ncbi:MAG: hypothetical protein KDC80_12490 [Saprospiraceae bacterium]|nr:hypothetical protein [Saprospiraceae bacterium]
MDRVRLFGSSGLYWVWIWLFLAKAGISQDCQDPLPEYDYSRVGYHEGEDPLPYGQKEATYLFGPGRFTIDSLIRLSDGEILRGAGPDHTILYFPAGLKTMGEPCGHEGVDCFDWGNAVIRAEGREIGIEDLSIEFPEHAWCHYCGKENEGYNAISLRRSTDCWVKNVKIRNSDSAIFIEDQSSNNTVESVTIIPQIPGKAHLHIAVSGYSTYNLIRDFRLFGSSFHGLTANWGSASNVFTNGWGESLRIEPDHNCKGPGGVASCCPHILYSNITGKVESIQTVNRAKEPLNTDLWNVGERTRCPVDAYQAQKQK